MPTASGDARTRLWENYVYRYPAFLRVRDTVIVANTIGLLGYVLVPTAPPRLLPGEDFVA